MAIVKMRLVNIISDKEHLDEVLLRFTRLDNFHPELASKIVENVHAIKTLNDENPYPEVITILNEAMMVMGIKPNIKENAKQIDIASIKNNISDIQTRYNELSDAKQEINKVIAEYESAIKQLKNLEDTDISLDELFNAKYLKVRFGCLPLGSEDKIKYYTDRPFVFKKFNSDNSYCWCMYITTPRFEGEVDNIFSSLYFERVRIPEFVHGVPSRAEETIQEEIEANKLHLKTIDERINSLVDKAKEELSNYASSLKFHNETFEARKYVVCLGERFSITGFVAKNEVQELKNKFADLQNVEIEDRPAHSDKRLTPPTKLRNRWFARPFQLFVEMYGMPSYEDFDPTLFVALSYSLLFGIMFGDLGQGLLLIILSAILYKVTHLELAAVGVRIGMFSAFFGFWYGSFFGNEEILTPIFTNGLHMIDKPIEVLDSNFIMPLLITTLVIGAVLLVSSMVLNTYLSIKHHAKCELWCSSNGLAGLVFYLAILCGAGLLIGFNINVMNPIYIGLLIVVPILLMFFKEPIGNILMKQKAFPNGVGAFVTESFFEMFEVMLTFITNTMSFLRVAGFVLSHAGMMLVVMTLSEMVGGAGSIIVIILGNLFVMGMEGMIVGIQVLRLEFYELFSRYYTGEGKPFISLKAMELEEN
ncbi:MAG: V-type ATPase 116kDa subunit family protein [Erysipelotrichaceae bacterium]